MKKSREVDYLIIGQGLAGSLLAWRLIEAGRRVLVIDNGNPSAASRVAAGLVNPVTGKRLVKQANAEIYLASARETYGRLAGHFGKVFFHDKPMLRLFDNDEIKQAWHKRHADPDYHALLDKELAAGECGYPQGGFLQRQTGYLATGLLLESLRQWLLQQSSLHVTQFDYADLQLGEQPGWGEYSADRIIFCEGARVSQNPWFHMLPMQPAQGEILTLHTDNKLPDWIVNGGQWLLPLANGIFKLGATYVWPSAAKPLEEQISQAGKQALLNALPRLSPAINTYEIIKQAVGIRPNSKDKRPFIGFHPEYNNLAVFNGFGSKGSMLIPYYSQHFVEVLLNNANINADVDIRRLKS